MLFLFHGWMLAEIADSSVYGRLLLQFRGQLSAVREARALNEACQSVTKQSTHGHPQKPKEY